MGRSVAEVFKERPVQWGLRGDPYLWNDLENHFKYKMTPYPEEEFTSEFYSAFKEFTGKSPDTKEDIYVPDYSHGGMSGGMVCAGFWMNILLPVFIARLHALNKLP